jgi:hypothetical protein
VTSLAAIGNTSLYAASGESFVFLLWDPPSPAPPSIALTDTWSDDGPAPHIGYHVFVDRQPSVAEAEKLAPALREALPANPVTTGFAWAQSPPREFALLAAVPVDIVDGGPVVAADATISVPAPMPQLTIAAGLAASAEFDLSAWTLTSPRPAHGRRAIGLGIALLGPAGGSATFEALLASKAVDKHSVKALAAVCITPLHPLDPQRNWIAPLGVEYVLSVDDRGEYHLSSAGEAR